MKLQLIYILGATALLSSCHLYSSYERPKDIKTDGLFRDTTATGNTLSTDTASFGNRPWREVFTDASLQSLIEKGLANNTDLQTASLRVQEAEATYLPAKMAFLPNLSFAPSGTISSFDGGKASQTYSIPIKASWQIDAFGGLRNAKEMAKANVLQSHAYRQAVQTQIISGIANMYYTLLMLDQQLNITRSTADIWKQNVEAMKLMFEHSQGVSAAAVAQSEANYHQICASIPELEKSIREAENGLCVVLHEAPHTIARTTLENQKFPSTLSTGVPMQLLANRPDVRSAEMSLASAFYYTNYARSQFYPQITLSGSAGWTNSAGGAIINPAKFLASAVGSLIQPLFANGQLIGKLRIAKAQQQEAQLAFEQSLLNAGEEVSNALYQYQASIEEQKAREKQVVSLTKAEEATKQLFQLGNSTYLEKLTAQQYLLSARLSLVTAQFSEMQAVVNLYQALGGGRN